jgi:DHA1 family tetracycline resistance protein-like MFS transporter
MNRRQASFLFIFITAAIDMIGIGIVIPSMPHIMQRFYSDPGEISRTYGYFISTFSLMQFLASPLLGALSDRFGRRPILLNSLFISGFDYLLMAFARGSPPRASRWPWPTSPTSRPTRTGRKISA